MKPDARRLLNLRDTSARPSHRVVVQRLAALRRLVRPSRPGTYIVEART